MGPFAVIFSPPALDDFPCFIQCPEEVRYSCFGANIFDGPICFDGVQYEDDLMLSKMGFAHGDLFKGHILYAERSLKVNNSIYWMLTLAQEL